LPLIQRWVDGGARRGDGVEVRRRRGVGGGARRATGNCCGGELADGRASAVYLWAPADLSMVGAALPTGAIAGRWLIV
jgi:hypothetical protein